MRNTIVINAFGGPGSGKTTACFQIACELKKTEGIKVFDAEREELGTGVLSFVHNSISADIIAEKLGELATHIPDQAIIYR